MSTATSSSIAGPVTGHKADLQRALLVGACVVLPGFVALALLGSLGTYPAGLPGFWDYPSGTIGDALLVPIIIIGLFVQAQALRQWAAPSERPWQVLGTVIGAIGGAAVPLSWYLDPHTSHIWMLPEAHHYLLAGWWHFAYLTATTALLGYLIVTVLGRLHRAPSAATGLPEGYAPTAMTFVVGAGLGMLMLIGRDAVAGGKTAASATTIVSLLAVAAIFLGGVAWAAGAVRWRLLLTPAAIVSAFLVGLLGVIVRWEPHDPVIIGLGAITAALACVAATSPLGSHSKHAQYRWPTAVAMTAVVTGGLIRSSDSLLRGQSGPLLWLVAGVVLAFALLLLVDRGRNDLRRVVRYSFFVGYCMLMYYLAVRIRSSVGENSAGASVSVADAAFDVMVFTLIQTRFGDLGEGDKHRVEAEFISSPEEASTTPSSVESSGPGAVVVDMLLLGIAVGLSLFMLLVVAAEALGLDRNAVDVPAVRVVLLVGTILVGALGLLSDSLLWRWRARQGEPPTDSRLLSHGSYLPRWFAVGAVAAALVWITTILCLSGGPVHLPLLASLAAAVVFAFSMRTLLSTPVLLQMLRPTLRQIALCLITATATALGSFWFISMGIWQGSQSLTGAWFTATTICVFAGTTIVYIAAGLALTTGLPRAKRPKTQYVLARETIRGYIGLDAINLGVVFLIGIALPLYAATRDQELHASSLSVIASMVFLPGLISAMFWGLHSWRIWEDLNAKASRTGVSRPIFALADNDWNEAEIIDARRAKRFQNHLRLNRYSVIALMACGLTYLAEVLLQ
ncbi:MAG: hypothetical protein ACJ75S_07810 [Solirubrobacterales bacterium]